MLFELELPYKLVVFSLSFIVWPFRCYSYGSCDVITVRVSMYIYYSRQCIDVPYSMTKLII